jgi:hypothetical protein
MSELLLKLVRLCLFGAFVIAVPLAVNAEPVKFSAYSEASKTVSEKTHWITTSSGIRHNSRCRYFKNSNGRMCTPDEGRACKICGG